MKLRSALISLSTIGLLVSASSITFAQSDAQDPAPVTSVLNKEIVTEDDQRKRKLPRQATHNIGLKNGTDIICKKTEQRGTRLRAKKICKTRAQWDVERLEMKRNLEEITGFASSLID